MTISIHAPREGGDRAMRKGAWKRKDFNPRPPRGGRPDSAQNIPTAADFNPRPPRGGRHQQVAGGFQQVAISIHAPREGGDPMEHAYKVLHFDISIHAPREGGDNQRPYQHIHQKNFNPRPPRGGRLAVGGGFCTQKDFNPRPPRGGRHFAFGTADLHRDFNPRPPRGGRQQRCTVLPADL